MSTPSGSTAPDAGSAAAAAASAAAAAAAAAKDNAIPQGDSSNMEVEEDSTLQGSEKLSSGDSSAPGDDPSGVASADAGDQTTLDEAAKPADSKVAWTPKKEKRRSSSVGHSATTERSVKFGPENRQWFNKASPSSSVQGLGDGSLATGVNRAQPNSDAVPSGNQLPTVPAPGSSFSCESLLIEIQSAGSTELSYKREIFEQKFTRARQLCYDLLDNQGNSVAQFETLKRLNELLYVCVTYSDFLKGRLGLVPDSDLRGDLKDMLERHDQEVREIQNLKALLLNVSNDTDGRDTSRLPTTDQTITFIRNVQAGMVVRYCLFHSPKLHAHFYALCVHARMCTPINIGWPSLIPNSL